MEDIINRERPHFDKSGLGYNSIVDDKKKDYNVSEDNHMSYADILKTIHQPQHQKIVNARMQPENERTIKAPEQQDLRSN